MSASASSRVEVSVPVAATFSSFLGSPADVLAETLVVSAFAVLLLLFAAEAAFFFVDLFAFAFDESSGLEG